jgi:UDP-glucose 4-epimerase
VYGIVDELPVRESQPQRPVTIAGVAKKAAADALGAYREMHGIEFTALALATVYGPRDERGPIAVFARTLKSGRPTTLTGDGRQTRDLLYVDDAVDALVRAAERGSGLLVNIGSGMETSILDVFHTVARHAGMPDEAALFEPARPGERHRMVLDPGRARIHLGWSSWTTLDEGIADTLAATA